MGEVPGDTFLVLRILYHYPWEVATSLNQTPEGSVGPGPSSCCLE